MSTLDQKIEWMRGWATRNGCILELESECGFGRACVGVTIDGKYPDYEWYNQETCERLDENGAVWVPKDAYYFRHCIAVLGRGASAVNQLYDWLKWFENNNFYPEVVDCGKEGLCALELFMGSDKHSRMVKKRGN